MAVFLLFLVLVEETDGAVADIFGVKIHQRLERPLPVAYLSPWATLPTPLQADGTVMPQASLGRFFPALLGIIVASLPVLDAIGA